MPDRTPEAGETRALKSKRSPPLRKRLSSIWDWCSKKS